MKGTIINISFVNKAIQIENTYQGKTFTDWFEVGNNKTAILETIQKGESVDFTYDLKGKQKFIKTFVKVVQETPKVELVPANVKEEKSEYQEKQEAREDIILKQSCGKTAAEILKTLPNNISSEHQITTWKILSVQIYEFMKEKEWKLDKIPNKAIFIKEA